MTVARSHEMHGDTEPASRTAPCGPAAPAFRYDEAFSRNLGWVTADEQHVLRRKRVAIAGLGGVGGSHTVTLSRLGIGGFHLADFDAFELSNFNRQAGATVAHLGRPKVDVLAAAYGSVLSDVEIVLPAGLTEVTPRRADPVPAGGETFVFARMNGKSIDGNVTIRGRVGNDKFEQTYPAKIASTTDAEPARIRSPVDDPSLVT